MPKLLCRFFLRQNLSKLATKIGLIQFLPTKPKHHLVINLTKILSNLSTLSQRLVRLPRVMRLWLPMLGSIRCGQRNFTHTKMHDNSSPQAAWERWDLAFQQLLERN